jgi:hypothetical protein
VQVLLPKLLLQALCLLVPLPQVRKYLALLLQLPLLLALRPAAVADAVQQASVLVLLQALPC